MSFFKRSGPKAARGPRIKSTKTANGFPSKLEESVYNILVLREKAGEIKDIRRQHKITYPCGIGWKIDFSATEVISGDTLFFEAKGFETEVYRLKRRMYEGCPVLVKEGNLEIWKGTYKSPQLSDTIKAKGMKE